MDPYIRASGFSYDVSIDQYNTEKLVRHTEAVGYKYECRGTGLLLLVNHGWFRDTYGTAVIGGTTIEEVQKNWNTALSNSCVKWTSISDICKHT